MDILFDPAKFQPIQLRTAAAGSAGARFDALLGESRDRVESDDLRAHRPAEPGGRDTPEREEGIVPDPEPRRDERDEDSAPDSDSRERQRAPDAVADKPGDPQQPQRVVPGDTAAEVADAARLAVAAQTGTEKAAATTKFDGTSAPAPARSTLAAAAGTPASQSPLPHGPVPQGTEAVTPPGPRGTRPLVRLAPSPRPPIAPPQGALGAQAALAAQSVAAGAMDAQPGAQGAVSGKTAVQSWVSAMASTDAADTTETTSSDAAKRTAAGPKNLPTHHGATAVQSLRAPGNTPANPPPFKLPSAPADSGAPVVGQAGARPLGLLGFAAPSVGLSISLSGDYATPASRPAATLPVTAEQVAVQIHKAANVGQDRVNIKLHPANLGRVLVKLEWADDGTLRAVISAERSETLDLLQRDSRALERALQEAGLKTDSGSLSFDLRGHAGHRDTTSETETDAPARSDPQHPGEDTTSAEADAPTGQRSHDGFLDLSV